MPRPRKPSKILELTGAFAKNPQRRAARAGEPVVTAPLGPPPARLTDPLVIEAWRELAAAGSWFTAADRPLVESTAHMLANAWRVKWAMAAPEFSALHRAYGYLGLTPSDRSKVKVPEAPKPANRFAGLRRGA